jgi:hypothetical protein
LLTSLAVAVAIVSPAPPSNATLATYAVQEAALRRMSTGNGEDYFRHYCLAVIAGTVALPISMEDRMRSVAARPDPSRGFLARVRRFSPRVVPASECDASGEHVVHRPTHSHPSILIVVGPVEFASETRARLVTFSTSGSLTETWALDELVRDAAGWRVESSKILLQA